MVIYRAKNLLTRKCYIGQAKDFYKRKEKHLRQNVIALQYRSLFYEAAKKYPLNSSCWEWTVLCEVQCQNDLNRAEIAFINYYKSLELSYNIASGGQGGNTLEGNPNISAIKKRMSISAKKASNRPSVKLAKVLSRRKFYENVVERVHLKNKMKEVHSTEKARRNHSEAMKRLWKTRRKELCDRLKFSQDSVSHKQIVYLRHNLEEFFRERELTIDQILVELDIPDLYMHVYQFLKSRVKSSLIAKRKIGRLAVYSLAKERVAS